MLTASCPFVAVYNTQHCRLSIRCYHLSQDLQRGRLSKNTTKRKNPDSAQTCSRRWMMLWNMCANEESLLLQMELQRNGRAGMDFNTNTALDGDWCAAVRYLFLGRKKPHELKETQVTAGLREDRWKLCCWTITTTTAVWSLLMKMSPKSFPAVSRFSRNTRCSAKTWGMEICST